MWSQLLATVIYLVCHACVSCTNREPRIHIPSAKIGCGSFEAVSPNEPSAPSFIDFDNPQPLLEIGGTAALHTSATDLRSSTHKCGASLISDRYLITAAHCLLGSERVISISLGREDLDVNPVPGPDTYTIEDYVIHPDYGNAEIEYNNIAIIKTDREVRFSEKIWPFCLPEKNQTYYGFVQIAGWGQVSATSKPSNIHTAFVSLNDLSRCEASWRERSPDLYDNITRFVYPQGLTNQLLCAGRIGVDACLDDDGGPMTYQNSKGFQVVIGVIAKRIDCPEEPVNPGFYTNVAYYTDWIYDTTQLSRPSLPGVVVDGATGAIDGAGGSAGSDAEGVEGDHADQYDPRLPEIVAGAHPGAGTQAGAGSGAGNHAGQYDPRLPEGVGGAHAGAGTQAGAGSGARLPEGVGGAHAGAGTQAGAGGGAIGGGFGGLQGGDAGGGAGGGVGSAGFSTSSQGTRYETVDVGNNYYSNEDIQDRPGQYVGNSAGFSTSSQGTRYEIQDRPGQYAGSAGFSTSSQGTRYEIQDRPGQYAGSAGFSTSSQGTRYEMQNRPGQYVNAKDFYSG